MFDNDEFKKRLKAILSNWSDDDLDAMLAWMVEDKEDFKHFVDLYVEVIVSGFELQNLLDKP
jgi:hypothetical protein